MALTREQRSAARAFFVANELAPPYDRELDELQKILAEQARAAEQGQAGLVEIGTLRARLFAPFDCLWNGLVRDFTAADEIAGGLCNAAAVTEALIRCVIDRAHLDRSFPERHESGLRGLFDLPQLAPLDSDFKHEEDCPCFGDEPEHSIDCKNCTCDKQPAAGDVVERMCSDYGNLTGTDPDPVAMAAALAVARDGYVSLEKRDAQWEKEIRFEIGSGWGLNAEHVNSVVHHILRRLAKPAEQTDEQKVEAILNRFPWPQGNWASQEQIAAEIVAALRDGKEGK